MKLVENWYHWPWFVFYFVNQGYIKVVSCLCSNQGQPGGGGGGGSGTPGGGQRLVDFSYLNHRRKYDVTSGEKISLRSSELGSVLARRSAMS